MPRVVAMERPHARVIGFELDDQVPKCTEHVGVPALRVLNSVHCYAVPGSFTFGEDELNKHNKNQVINYVYSCVDGLKGQPRVFWVGGGRVAAGKGRDLPCCGRVCAWDVRQN